MEKFPQHRYPEARRHVYIFVPQADYAPSELNERIQGLKVLPSHYSKYYRGE